MVSALLLGNLGRGSSKDDLRYSEFLNNVRADQVERVKIDQVTGKIDGVLKNGTEFHANGPQNTIPDEDIALLDEHKVARDYKPRSSDFIGSMLVWLLPFGLLIGLWVWMGRRAQGQMAGIMNIGRSKAKVYTTEKPKTTFADVAGYSGVKEEITEVVDFLKNAGKFKEIGARIPKGVLLVGPPGTGKTLIARAVAGEAGVPFISVTGSDFMEMFVGRRARPGSATCSRPPASRPRPSSSSTRSTPSAASGAPASAAATTSGSRPSTRCSRRWTGSRPPRAS